MKLTIAVAMLGTLAAGCVMPPATELPDNHPASAKAPEAPVVPPSQTLTISDAPATAPATQPARPAQKGHDHAHH